MKEIEIAVTGIRKVVLGLGKEKPTIDGFRAALGAKGLKPYQRRDPRTGAVIGTPDPDWAINFASFAVADWSTLEALVDDFNEVIGWHYQ